MLERVWEVEAKVCSIFGSSPKASFGKSTAIYRQLYLFFGFRHAAEVIGDELHLLVITRSELEEEVALGEGDFGGGFAREEHAVGLDLVGFWIDFDHRCRVVVQEVLFADVAGSFNCD